MPYPGRHEATVSGLSDHAYNMDGKILRIKKSGGEVQTVALGLDNPREITSNDGRIQFRMGRHYERNNWTEELGYFEIDPAGGHPKKLGPRPYFSANQNRCSQRTEYYGPSGEYEHAAHYYLEREDSTGKTDRIYATDHGIFSLILDRGELLWLEGTGYSLMKMKLPENP